MTDEERIDARLAALLAAPAAAPDEAFVARIERVVRAEQQFAAARSRAWRRFAAECAASAAMISAFYLLWRLAPAAQPFEPPPIGPAAAALLLLFLWFGVVLRPAATGR